MQNDTIAAIATAMSPSGIGIIRISGDDALSVIDRIYKSKNNKTKISACQSHTIHYGFIYDGDEKIDEVMVLLMKAPNTYTREDTVEIDCHGGVYVMKRVLEAVIKNGARPAEPGEFTKRAFYAVKCEGYARIDFMLRDNKAYLMEINTLPGMTMTSLVPKSLKHLGVSYSELLDKLIEVSLKIKR